MSRSIVQREGYFEGIHFTFSISRSEPGLHWLIKEAVAKRWQAVTSLLRASVLQPEPVSTLGLFSHPLSRPDYTWPMWRSRGRERESGAIPHAMAAFTSTPKGRSRSAPRHRDWDQSPAVCDWKDCEAGGGERSTGHSTMLEKTQDFFQICDIEDKGFITHRDMQVRSPTVYGAHWVRPNRPMGVNDVFRLHQHYASSHP